MSLFITTYIWRQISPETRRAVLRVLRRERVIGRYVADVAADLCARNRWSVANDLVYEAECIRRGVTPHPPR